MKISQKNLLKITTTLVVVFLFIILIRWIYLMIQLPAVDVSETTLKTVLKPGKYIGKSVYTPTPLYKNGLTTTNHLVISENDAEGNLQYINEVVARDRKTNELQYTGVRKGKFFYKPNHGEHLFNTSESYIDGKIVSSSRGYAVYTSPNVIDLKMDSSWHVMDNKFNNVDKKMKRVGNELYADFTHPTLFGGSHLTMNEKYTQVQ